MPECACCKEPAKIAVLYAKSKHYLHLCAECTEEAMRVLHVDPA